MADQNTQFYAILTNVGAAKQANADALGVPWKITQMGVGDANGAEPTPNATQTRLINEWRRAPLNQLKVDEKNNAIIVAEQVIPAEVGGKWIREIALYDADGDMVAVANCPPTYKPLLNQGSGRTQVVRMNLLVSSSSNVELKIDPAVVLATREYVDSRITEEISKLDNKQSVRVATTGNIALAGLQAIDGVQLVAGDRVLVKSQAAGKDNGLYAAAVGAWSRTADADASPEVTPGLVVAVEQGATLADTIWQLITDAPIILGSTALTFRDITDGFARLLSPAFAGTPTSTTPDQFDSSKRLATTEFLKRMGLEYSSFWSVTANAALTAGNIGGLISAAGAAPITITLPPTAGVAQGATLSVVSSGAGAVTVAAAGSDIVNTSTGAGGSIVLGLGDSAEFIKLTGQWRLVGGSIMLRYSQVLREGGFTTRPQFDNAQYLATTEFVQRSLGNQAGVVSFAASANLTLANAGALVMANMAANGFITLPAGAIPGIAFHIVNWGIYDVTLVANSGSSINAGGGIRANITIKPGCSARVISENINSWVLAGGSAEDMYSPLFHSSLGPAGWAKRPDGLIEQWGQGQTDANGLIYITFPIAFPNAVFNITPMHLGSLSLMHNVMGATITKTSCQVRIQNSANAAQAGWTAMWRAIGN
ncbi:phage tail protein [Pseudomonas alloputida]|uniref:phage tail protein n=1 Tax=Pseudomonas alloputida TaxID=1940621 RepID=UPI003917694D